GYATGRRDARQPVRDGVNRASGARGSKRTGCLSLARLIIWRGTSGGARSRRAMPKSNHTNPKEVVMKNWRTLTAVAASVALLAGCTTNPYTGEQQAGKVGVYGGLGAVAGAAVGAATSSKKDRKKGALIGA